MKRKIQIIYILNYMVQLKKFNQVFIYVLSFFIVFFGDRNMETYEKVVNPRSFDVEKGQTHYMHKINPK